MSNLPPDGYPARQHPHPHHQPYYAPPAQHQSPHQPQPPPGPPPGMYQALPQQPYYGAPPMGPPQQQAPAGYFPPQAQYNPQQYPQQQPPPPGYAQPYGQPQQPQYYAPQPHTQPPGSYPPNGGNNFPPASSRPMQYQQSPQGNYPQNGNYASPPPTSHAQQNGAAYGGQYPPTSMGNNYSQQPPYNNNAAAYGQQPYPHHQLSNGYNAPPPPHGQPSIYTAQSYNNATNSGGNAQGAMNPPGSLMHKDSYPDASAPTLSISNSLTQLCPSGLPLIEGDTCRAPIKMRVEEKIMEASGDSFYVTDYKKKILYNVDGSRTPDQHKILKTAKGKPLLQMRQFSTVAKKIVISNMHGESIATLQKQRVDSNTHKRIDATIHQTTNGHTKDIGKFIVAGNAQASSFKAENCREEVVAEISRASRSMKKIFSGQDSYTAEVSAGSPAFMVMVVVAIDEMYSDG